MSESLASSKAKRRVDEYEKENIGAAASKKRKRAKDSKDASDGSKVVRKPRKNSKIGRLALLLQMPVDVFYEIAQSLSPGDLLNLARSTKSWRKLLMSRNSKAIWRAARDNVGLPDCPEDLSEPAYADLLYSWGCMFCDARRAKNIYFAFRLRLCKSCFRENTRLGNHIVYDYAPLLRSNGDNTPYKLEPYHIDRLDKYDVEWKMEQGFMYFWEDDFVEVLNKYTSLYGNEKQEYVKRREQDTAKIIEHTRLVGKWLEEQERKKVDEKKAIADRRRESVLEKLRELGYKDDDFYIREEFYQWCQLTEEPKELTERAWIRIKPELVRIIESERRLSSAWLEFISAYEEDMDEATDE